MMLELYSTVHFIAHAKKQINGTVEENEVVCDVVKAKGSKLIALLITIPLHNVEKMFEDFGSMQKPARTRNLKKPEAYWRSIKTKICRL